MAADSHQPPSIHQQRLSRTSICPFSHHIQKERRERAFRSRSFAFCHDNLPPHHDLMPMRTSSCTLSVGRHPPPPTQHDEEEKVRLCWLSPTTGHPHAITKTVCHPALATITLRLRERVSRSRHFLSTNGQHPFTSKVVRPLQPTLINP